jgi:hypothetical protein
MRLRSNELCPIHKSLSCCGREFIPKPKLIRLGVQRVEDPHHPRGYRELRSAAEMRKLLNRKIVLQAGYAPSATKTSRITTTWSRTTSIRREWEDRGGTITQTISRQHIGGVTKKTGQPEWMNDGRSVFCRRACFYNHESCNNLPELSFFGVSENVLSLFFRRC